MDTGGKFCVATGIKVGGCFGGVGEVKGVGVLIMDEGSVGLGAVVGATTGDVVWRGRVAGN